MTEPKPSLTSLSESPSLDIMALSMPLITTVSLAVVALISLIIIINSSKSKIPLANPPDRFQTVFSRRVEFITHGLKIIDNARKRYGKQPYRLITDVGEIIVLPPSYAQTIRNDKALHFGTTFTQDFHGHLTGYEPFGILSDKRNLAQQVIKKQLTKHLNFTSKPLSNETTFALDVVFGDSSEWKETNISHDVHNVVARLSSKVFLGDKLCRDETWLKLSNEYVQTAVESTKRFLAWPEYLKFIIPWVSKDAKLALRQLNGIRAILNPIVKEREVMKAEARKMGKPVPIFEDTLEWLQAESKGAAYDPAVYQMLLTVAAIHTTSDLLSQIMMRLGNEPRLIDDLRAEIISVLGAEGFSKASIANLKLMDSALKETQRIKPLQMLAMERVAEKTIDLPGGLTINKGDRLAVDTYSMLDPEVYPNPEKYDIYRYLRMRESTDNATKALFVTTSPENLTFGHGYHACPGRFFAALEIKIALCHLLIKYDWELLPGSNLEPFVQSGDQTGLDPSNMMRFRRRKEEIDLDSLSFI
ncbi:cytochrome P450 monooxygenase-like protein [Paraphoma chrysanthemicola]|uniref:Cytochrome P450 monooxygenase-like protein n=1 Tax=Paraphoma chrysanthemicola TaxID=798071 RepID=A0A8K0VRN0_9PLEO|nr:cytochrome P450 monooxygenase-like protein [Paraphoma chrysanthemicola]